MQPSIQENTNVKWADELNAIQGKPAHAGTQLEIWETQIYRQSLDLLVTSPWPLQELEMQNAPFISHFAGQLVGRNIVASDRSSSQPKHGTSVPRSHTSYCQLQL